MLEADLANYLIYATLQEDVVVCCFFIHDDIGLKNRVAILTISCDFVNYSDTELFTTEYNAVTGIVFTTVQTEFPDQDHARA